MIQLASLVLSAHAQDVDFEVVVPGAHVMYVDELKAIKFKVHNTTSEPVENVQVELIFVEADRFIDLIMGLDDYPSCSEVSPDMDGGPSDLQSTCSIDTLGPDRSRVFRLDIRPDPSRTEFVVGGRASTHSGNDAHGVALPVYE